MLQEDSVIDLVINLLERNDALHLENNERQASPDDLIFGIDWDRLLQDDWVVDDADFLSAISELPNRSPLDHPQFSWPEDIANEKQSVWDICAWYQPIHFFGYEWGIYIREDCLKIQALKIAYAFYKYPHFTHTSLSPQELARIFLRASFFCFFLHEHFHHKVESFAIRLLVASDRPVYHAYKKNIYRKYYLTSDCLEESLANADLYQRLHDTPYKFPYLDKNHPKYSEINKEIREKIKHYLQSSFLSSPDGYNQAVDYFQEPKFNAGIRLLQGQIKESLLKPIQPIDDWIAAPQMLRSLLNIQSSIYTVVKPGKFSILPIVTPQTCSTQEMIAIYRKQGYEVVSGGKGSHIKLVKSGKPFMIIPGNRKDLSPNVLRSALRLLGSNNLTYWRIR
jgi:predicted RNA binding protein YcfA (HicA-like mRNA interferase family)